MKKTYLKPSVNVIMQHNNAALILASDSNFADSKSSNSGEWDSKNLDEDTEK